MQNELFADHPFLGRGKKEDIRRMSYGLPPVPETGWVMPKEFPRLDSAKMICIDCETWDPELLEHGPGWGRGVGHIVGLAVGTEDARWYFPMRHTLGQNLPPNVVLEWAKEAFAGPQPKVFANAQYDMGWLAWEGVTVNGPIIDVQIAEPLLDEHANSYSLDTLAVKYLGEHKVDTLLYDWAHRAYGGNPGRVQAGNIYRCPSELVGPYAEGDVTLPLKIWEHQKKLLEQQELGKIFAIESQLPRILVGMRLKGVRVNLEAAEQAKKELRQKVVGLVSDIKNLSGVAVDLWAADSVAKAFSRCGVPFGKTPTGKPSFPSDWLEHHDHPLAGMLRQARKYDKAIGTFIDGYVINSQVNGRVHGQFHQLRSDNGGTVVGRFSSSLPNLENLPARDPEIGSLVRGLFLPEEGQEWHCADFSQIQFRIMTHYAIGKGAEEAREKYNSDPTTDYHNMTKQLIYEITGEDLSRKVVKNINFGLAFTMGVDKLAGELGLTVEEATPLINAYHAGVPFIRQTSDIIAATAQKRGYIKGILGRRHRFLYWEPAEWRLRGQVKLSKDHDEVERLVKLAGGRKVVRAFCQLGLNRLAQDGEGSHMKKALVDCYNMGLFDQVGYPLNIVHDDVSFSTQDEAAIKEVTYVMENAVEWKVPIRVEREKGASWGALEKVK